MSSPYATGLSGPHWGDQPAHQPPYARPPEPPQPSSALAILAFIASLVAFFFGWVPFIGIFLGLLGLLLSVLAVRKPHLRGMSIAGIVMSTLATLTSLVITGLLLIGILGSSGSSTDSSAPPPSYAPEDFVEVDERTLSGIARDPDSHAGETLTVYAHITQFDANTGPCSMRVSIAAEQQSSWYEYEHNSLAYSGDGDSECPDLDDVVEDDEVKLSVVLHGGESYSSIGGRNMVPHLEIIEVEVL